MKLQSISSCLQPITLRSRPKSKLTLRVSVPLDVLLKVRQMSGAKALRSSAAGEVFEKLVAAKGLLDGVVAVVVAVV
jgi:hypothetical protein